MNTVVQLGTTLGPAVLGTVSFGRLVDAGYASATGAGLAAGIGLSVVALLACLALPRPARPA